MISLSSIYTKYPENYHKPSKRSNISNKLKRKLIKYSKQSTAADIKRKCRGQSLITGFLFLLLSYAEIYFLIDGKGNQYEIFRGNIRIIEDK